MENIKITPNQWEVSVNELTKNKEIFVNQKDGAGICRVFHDNEVVTSREMAIANANLIANAPEGIRVAIQTYLFLQRRSNELVGFAIETDELRATLRNHIASALGKNGKEVQEWIEAEAYKKV